MFDGFSIRKSGAQVRVFSHAQRTLEDAFLEAVR